MAWIGEVGSAYTGCPINGHPGLVMCDVPCDGLCTCGLTYAQTTGLAEKEEKQLFPLAARS